MINYRAIQKILGIDDVVSLTPDEMFNKLLITFYPVKNKTSKEVEESEIKLRQSLKKLNVGVLPYESVLFVIPIHKIRVVYLPVGLPRG